MFEVTLGAFDLIQELLDGPADLGDPEWRSEWRLDARNALQTLGPAVGKYLNDFEQVLWDKPTVDYLLIEPPGSVDRRRRQAYEASVHILKAVLRLRALQPALGATGPSVEQSRYLFPLHGIRTNAKWHRRRGESRQVV